MDHHDGWGFKILVRDREAALPRRTKLSSLSFIDACSEVKQVVGMIGMVSLLGEANLLGFDFIDQQAPHFHNKHFGFFVEYHLHVI